jgi:hypothetical protein
LTKVKVNGDVRGTLNTLGSNSSRPMLATQRAEITGGNSSCKCRHYIEDRPWIRRCRSNLMVIPSRIAM